MRNAPEVVREVGVDDVRVAAEHQLLHLYDCLLGASLSAVGIDFRRKIGFPACGSYLGWLTAKRRSGHG